MRYDYINIKNTAFIGDVHGCYTLLLELLVKLEDEGITNIVFLGDLVDRGPHPYEVVETVYKLVLEGKARAVVGNHDWKFLRMFDGKTPKLGDDQNKTLEDVGNTRMEAFKNNFLGIFKDRDVFLLDTENKFIVSHAIAIRPAKVHNIVTDPTRNVAKWFWTGFLYGKTDNVEDARGYPRRLPITYNETDDLEGWKAVIGHYHANNLYLENGNKNVMCVDFCAGEGGKLAALTFTEGLEPRLVFSDSTL